MIFSKISTCPSHGLFQEMIFEVNGTSSGLHPDKAEDGKNTKIDERKGRIRCVFLDIDFWLNPPLKACGWHTLSHWKIVWCVLRASGDLVEVSFSHVNEM